MRQLHRQRLTGEVGLLVAVMAMAVSDLESGNKKQRLDAAEYLTGEHFEYHLEVIELAVDRRAVNRWQERARQIASQATLPATASRQLHSH